jgi:hypothetical protein
MLLAAEGRRQARERKARFKQRQVKRPAVEAYDDGMAAQPALYLEEHRRFFGWVAQKELLDDESLTLGIAQANQKGQRAGCAAQAGGLEVQEHGLAECRNVLTGETGHLRQRCAERVFAVAMGEGILVLPPIGAAERRAKCLQLSIRASKRRSGGWPEMRTLYALVESQPAQSFAQISIIHAHARLC